GDEIDIHLKVDGDKIKDIKFEGRGCAISQASASMLTEMVQGKPLTSVKDLSKDDILENIGLMNLGPARIKCALLSLKVLKLGMVRPIAQNFNTRYYRLWNPLEQATCKACGFSTYFAPNEEGEACPQCGAKM